MADKEQNKLETECRALNLPSRICQVTQLVCNEVSRYDCKTWRESVQGTAQRTSPVRFKGEYQGYLFEGEFIEQ